MKYFFYSLMIVALAFMSCRGSSFDLAQGQINLSLEYGGGCTDLMAGQNEVAGEVCLELEGENLVLNYTTTGDWTLEEVHAFVGESSDDIPQTKKGTFKNGNFPYKAEDLSTTSYTFVIPVTDIVGSVEDLCDNTLVVAAHAVVSRELDGDAGVQEETAWGSGTEQNDDRNWAMYFTVSFSCEPETDGGPVVGTCETAFAVGETTFIELELTDSRWGWQLGPYAPGSYEAPIYAAAGQNDLSKGTHVGTLFVNYDGTTVTVSYDLFPGFKFDETHLYLDVVVADTIAPGQYGNQHDLSGEQSDQYVIGGFNGEPVYIVAHAVVCEE